jgi:large subunit ribosomal protein L30
MAATTSKRKAAQPVNVLRVTYSTSSIGVEYDQKDTVRRLGLKRLGQVVEHADTPALRGMLHKVRHLVSVEEIER